MSPVDVGAPFAVTETEVVAPGIPGAAPTGALLRVTRPQNGGWEGRPGLVLLGDGDHDRVASTLAGCGVVVVRPTAPVPGALADALPTVQAVVGWVRAAGPDLGLDPDCLGVLSAGGLAHLAPFVALHDSEGTHPPLRWAVALAPADWPSGLPIFLPDDRPPAGLPRLWIGQLAETAAPDDRPGLRNWLRAYLVAGGDAELEVFSGEGAECVAVARVADFLARQAPALVPFAGA